MCVERVGRVVELPTGEEGIAIVEVGTSLRRVSTALLIVEGVEVAVGDWLQTHTGLAVGVLPEAQALQLVADYEEMGVATAGSA